MSLSGAAAIVGIGATDFSKDSGRSELRLAAEAVNAALADAGLTPADVDGLVTFTMDTNMEVAVARATGMGELTYFSRIHYGGGAACSTVQQAAMAVLLRRHRVDAGRCRDPNAPRAEAGAVLGDLDVAAVDRLLNRPMKEE